MYTKLISNCYDRIPGPERHHQTRHSYNEGRKLQIRLIWFFRGPRYDVLADGPWRCVLSYVLSNT